MKPEFHDVPLIKYDARKRLDVPLATKKKFKDVEALLQAVYDQSND